MAKRTTYAFPPYNQLSLRNCTFGLENIKDNYGTFYKTSIVTFRNGIKRIFMKEFAGFCDTQLISYMIGGYFDLEMFNRDLTHKKDSCYDVMSIESEYDNVVAEIAKLCNKRDRLERLL